MKIPSAWVVSVLVAAAEESADGIKFSGPSKKLQRLDRMDERPMMGPDGAGRRNSDSMRPDEMPNPYDSMGSAYLGNYRGGGGMLNNNGMQRNDFMPRWRDEDSASYSNFQSVMNPRPETIPPPIKPARDFAGGMMMSGGGGGGGMMMGGGGGGGHHGGGGMMGGGGRGFMGLGEGMMMGGGGGGPHGGGMMGGGGGMMGGGGGMMGSGGRGFMGLGDPLNPSAMLGNNPLAPAAGIYSGLPPTSNALGMIPGVAGAPPPSLGVKGLADEIHLRGGFYEQGIRPTFQYPGSSYEDSDDVMTMMMYPPPPLSEGGVPPPPSQYHLRKSYSDMNTGNNGFSPFDHFNGHFDEAMFTTGGGGGSSPLDYHGRMFGGDVSSFPHPETGFFENPGFRRSQRMSQAEPFHHYENRMMKPF